MVQFHGWFPLSLVNGYNFHICVTFTWTSMNILQLIYASHHQGMASKKWMRISTFWHSITIFLFYLHFSCEYTLEVELRLKIRTCSCTEQFSSIKMMLNSCQWCYTHKKPKVLWSPWQWCITSSNEKLCRSATISNMQCYCKI